MSPGRKSRSTPDQYLRSTDPSHEVIERLIEDSPKLHFISEDDLKLLDEHAKKHGLHFSAGPASLAVHPDILRIFPKYVGSHSLTLETGCGYTTIALAALGKHHICISPDKMGRHLVEQYMERVGIPRHKVTFIEESSETALASLSLADKLDFAYVDGCHGYPFAALDWHFIDKHLKIGGYMGFDNVELPTVRHHCDFLNANGSYRLITKMMFGGLGDYQVNIYRKERDEVREWIFQAFNERKLPGKIERTMARVLPWRLVQVPLRKRFGWPRPE